MLLSGSFGERARGPKIDGGIGGGGMEKSKECRLNVKLFNVVIGSRPA